MLNELTRTIRARCIERRDYREFDAALDVDNDATGLQTNTRTGEKEEKIFIREENGREENLIFQLRLNNVRI